MTLAETRQLGIEFERRVQTLIPETEFLNKLDTDTIYSYLNQYQDKYIHEIYRNLDNIAPGSKASAHVESVLQSMLRSETISVDAEGVSDNSIAALPDPNGISIVDTARSITYPLPSNFYLYLRSVSNVSSTFSFKTTFTDSTDYIAVTAFPTSDIDTNKTYIKGGHKWKYESDEWVDKGVADPRDFNPTSIRVIPNMLVSQSDVWKLIETPHDSLRILRYPAAVLNKYTDGGKPTLSVIYDRYTTVKGIKVLYYAQPCHFDLMTSTACELSSDAFDDLVTGAVDLYVQYVAGAEARKRQLQQQQAQEAKQNRQRNNEDED